LKILIIDNYDSFTFNIVEQLRQFNITEIVVAKNDEISIENALAYSKIIISPGPKIPAESGIIIPLVQSITTQSVLGICLGMQAIAEAFGGNIYNLPNPYHGAQTSLNLIEPHSIFDNLATPIIVGLYHSWAVQSFINNDTMQVTSVSADNIVMSIKHRYLNIDGIQFHPESYLTKQGNQFISNWLAI
jgi:anthranilate synthase component II